MSSIRIAHKNRSIKPNEMGLVVMENVLRNSTKMMKAALKTTDRPFVLLEKCARWTFITTCEAACHPNVINAAPEALHGISAWQRALEIFTGLDPGGHPGESRGLNALTKGLNTDSSQSVPQQRGMLRPCLDALIADARTILQYVGPYTNPSPEFIATRTLACTLPDHPRIWLLGNGKKEMRDIAIALCSQRRAITFTYDSDNFSWVLPELHRQKFYPNFSRLDTLAEGSRIIEADLLIATEVMESTFIAQWRALPEPERPPLLWFPIQQPTWIPTSGLSNFYGQTFIEKACAKDQAERAEKFDKTRHRIANMAYSRSIGMSPIKTLLHLPAEDYRRAAEASKARHVEERLRHHPILLTPPAEHAINTGHEHPSSSRLGIGRKQQSRDTP